MSSAAEAKETEEKDEEEEPVENQANEPEDEAARPKPVSQASEDPLPQCPRCGNLDAEVAEPGATASPTGEAAGTPESAEEESKLDERRGRSKRRKRSKRMFYERRRRVHGELDLGCEGKEFHGLEENRFLGSRRGGFGVAGEIQAMKEEMPPLSDGIAMREHLRSWAIAVACAVK